MKTIRPLLPQHTRTPLAWLCRARASVAAAALGLAALNAQGAITPVTSPAGLTGQNDTFSWAQFGSTVGSSFSGTTVGNRAVTGSFQSGGGQLSSALIPGAVFSSTGGGVGSGPLTLELPGVSGVGAFIGSSVAATNTETVSEYRYYTLQGFTVSLSLYDGATLLGTVSASTGNGDDGVYLGALDTTGAHITRAVYRLSALTGITAPTSIGFNYDVYAGYTDPPYTAGLTMQDFIDNPEYKIYAPQKAFGEYNIVPSVPFQFLSELVAQGDKFTDIQGENYATSAPNASPNDLALVHVGGVGLAGAAVPEPSTALFGVLGLAVLLGRRRRALAP